MTWPWGSAKVAAYDDGFGGPDASASIEEQQYADYVYLNTDSLCSPIPSTQLLGVIAIPVPMTDFSRKLEKGTAEFSRAVEALISAESRFVGEANPPDTSGVYAFLIDGELMYVGEAKGSGGLRDRILRKHLAGDEGHALQRYFKDHFPDRALRREHIKRTVQVKWVAVANPEAVSVVERMAIWLLNPPLNRT